MATKQTNGYVSQVKGLKPCTKCGIKKTTKADKADFICNDCKDKDK